MRAKSSPFPAGQHGPRPTYSPGTLLLGTGLLFGVFVAGLIAVSHPIAVAVAGAAIVSLKPMIRLVRRHRHAREQHGQTRKVCIPKTGVCVEA